jgi:hypothetical protein
MFNFGELYQNINYAALLPGILGKRSGQLILELVNLHKEKLIFENP